MDSTAENSDAFSSPSSVKDASTLSSQFSKEAGLQDTKLPEVLDAGAAPQNDTSQRQLQLYNACVAK